MSPAYTPAFALNVISFNDDYFKKAVDMGMEGAQEASFMLPPIELMRPSGG
jgi:hypothetical protein